MTAPVGAPETPAADERWPAWLVDTAIAAGVSTALLAAMAGIAGGAAGIVSALLIWNHRQRQNGRTPSAADVRKWLLPPTSGNQRRPEIPEARFSTRIRQRIGDVLRMRTYPQGWVAGEASARAALTHRRETGLATIEPGITLDVDWSGWEPGDWQAARKLVDAEGDASGFRELLAEAGVHISKIADNRLDEVARCLADGLERGATPQQLARDLQATLEDRAWAMTVAWTETSRAISAAAEDTYRQAGVRTKGWMTALDQRVCPVCLADEAAGFVDINAPFPSGTLRPPGHPRCRCAPIPGPVPEEDDDVGKAVAPDLVKDYDPLQPRDDRGRWSKLGAALAEIGETMANAVRVHATFGGEHGKSDSHGIVTSHETQYFGNVYAVHLHDKDVGTSWVATLDGFEAAELAEALGEAVDEARAGRTGSIGYNPAPDEGGDWWRIDWSPEGITWHANIDRDDEEEEVLLSLDDAGTLADALDDVRDRDQVYDSLSAVGPLAEGETLIGKKGFGSESEWPLGAAVVDGPDGPTLRLAAIGNLADSGEVGYRKELKAYTGGQGRTSAVLTPEQAGRLADQIDAYADELGSRATHLQDAQDRYEEGEIDDDELADLSRPFATVTGPGATTAKDSADPSRAFDIDGHLPGQREIETPWGTIVVAGYSDEMGDWRMELGVRPLGAVENEDWSISGVKRNPDNSYKSLRDEDGSYGGMDYVTMAEGGDVPHAELEPGDVNKLIKYLREFAAGKSLLKMAEGQPRDDHGRWSRWGGISDAVRDGLESLYGPLIDVDSFHVGGEEDGNFNGWVSLHEDGTMALTAAASKTDWDNGELRTQMLDEPSEVMDSTQVRPVYWQSLADHLREAADSAESDEPEDLYADMEGPADDPHFTVGASEGDEGYQVDFETGANGWGMTPDDARSLADRVEWLVERREAWDDGEYDEDDEDEQDAEKAAAPGERGSSWEQQWKHGKLRKKWIGHPHPVRELHRHLSHHMPSEMAWRTANQWYKDVFGIWPGERKGDNPVGPG